MCVRYLSVLQWHHLNGTFDGVWVVSCWLVSCWLVSCWLVSCWLVSWRGAAWHGMLQTLTIWVDIWLVCVAAARKATIHINTQCQTILHTCHQWHLQLFSCPDWRSLVKAKAACVACWKVNKCKSLSKNCSSESEFFPARSPFDWMVEGFLQILLHPLAASKPKWKLHLYSIEE